MLYEFFKIGDRRFNYLVAILIAGLVVFAWTNRFIQDDAFISFRYADNFVKGNGLVWNIGERVEGYTNFLWTLLIAVGISIGADPISISFALGLISLIITLALTHQLARYVFGSRFLSIGTVVLLGTNYTFSAYATGGLETQMQTSLLVGICLVCMKGITEKRWGLHRLFLLSGLMAASVLTHPDSLLVCAIVFPTVVVLLLKRSRDWKSARLQLATLFAPFLLVCGVWIAWKLFYYGNVLPNPFYEKASSITSPAKGLHYLWLFVGSYLLLPLLVLAAFQLRTIFNPSNRVLLLPAAIVIVWCAYVIKIGGDFMEFRLLVPIMPLMFILITWAIAQATTSTYIRVSLICWVLAGCVYHAATFRYNPIDAVENINYLYGHLTKPNENWIAIGKKLHAIFDTDTSVCIATTAAGAIPFYSHLKTVDMLGINDPWVAREGLTIGNVPGHQRIASYGYLQRRGVNLVISNPVVIPRSDPTIATLPLLATSTDDELIRPDALEIPINKDYQLVTLYLTHNPIIDEAIHRYDWKMYSVALR